MAELKVKPYGDNSPYEWQKEVHLFIDGWLSKPKSEREPLTIVVKAQRQIAGKSAFAKSELARFALTQKDSINGYVAPKLSLARKMQKELAKAYYQFIESSNQMDGVITFKNGSQVRFHSSEQGDALRGFTMSGVLVIDEAAFQKDDTYTELIRAWTLVHKPLTIMLSTPQFRLGFFWEAFIAGLGNDKYTKTFDWVSDYNIAIPDEVLSLKATMPSRKWRAEYEGEFLDAEGSVFGDFSACILESINKEPQEVYFGLDFATGNGADYTALIGYDENGNQCFLWKTNDMSPVDQVEAICDIIKSFEYIEEIGSMGVVVHKSKTKIAGFIAEQNSIGSIYLDMLEQKGMRVERFVTTNDSKRELVEAFQVGIENKEIGLMKDNDLIQQLSFYESKVNTQTNKVSYNASAGFHDDLVMAALLGWKAYSRKNKSMYNIF